MRKAKFSIGAMLLAAAALSAVACGGFMNQVKQGVEDTQNLTFINTMYQSYITANKKPPTGPDDLTKIATTQQEKDALQAVKDNKLTINWNIDITDAKLFPLGKSNYVMGYSNAAIGDSRFVWTADGLVASIPEADYKKKAENKPSTAATPAPPEKGPAPGKDKKSK